MKSYREVEFIIELISKRSGFLWIGGRCSKGPFRVGDTFNLTYRYTPANTLEDYGRPSQRIDETSISLFVEGIITYGHEVDELDAGLTAELKVSGELTRELRQGDVLGKT